MGMYGVTKENEKNPPFQLSDYYAAPHKYQGISGAAICNCSIEAVYSYYKFVNSSTLCVYLYLFIEKSCLCLFLRVKPKGDG